MYIIFLSCVALILQIVPPVASSLGSLTREEGEDVAFMFNTSTAILLVTWGIRDGDSNIFKLKLISVSTRSGVQSFPNADYVGRVSFVGDLSKNQAWFKITNLNINDTNQYMAQIFTQGGTPGQYDYIFAKLIVTKRVITTPLTTSTRKATVVSSNSQTSLWSTTTQVPHLSNQSMSLKVVQEDLGDLSDPNSTAFKNFSQHFVSEINSVYANIDNFEKAKVTSLSENIVPVRFIVYFKNTIEQDEICAPLKNVVKDNRLGSLKIVPGSLTCSKEPSTSCPKNQSSTGSSCTSIIAVCVTINIFLILVIVVLLIYIWKSRSKSGKVAESRSSSIKEKDLMVYENAQLEDTTEAITTHRSSNTEKELYETINENRDQRTAAIPANMQPHRGPTAGARGNVPQHYQELQMKTSNPTTLYETLNKRDTGNKEELASEGTKTYEQLQQSAPGREYQSLKHYKETESKV